ncbi:hypothetical protein GRAN_4247 [Granulicella sibirica]|uniref:Uncharacterized protein n=1 Tax=Granulicella sibirica TaxID=2479048 RepID=A0A4Q0SVS6_9BACT|nr:hypothetical protein GRAN_4247 [Granulicella sibirica]
MKTSPKHGCSFHRPRREAFCERAGGSVASQVVVVAARRIFPPRHRKSKSYFE